MYEKYMQLLEEEAKIRNLKNRSILCYKNYVSYFLNYVGKDPQELSCQDVLLPSCKEGRRTQGHHAQPLQLSHPFLLQERPAYPLG